MNTRQANSISEFDLRNYTFVSEKIQFPKNFSWQQEWSFDVDGIFKRGIFKKDIELVPKMIVNIDHFHLLIAYNNLGISIFDKRTKENNILTEPISHGRVIAWPSKSFLHPNGDAVIIVYTLSLAHFGANGEQYAFFIVKDSQIAGPYRFDCYNPFGGEGLASTCFFSNNELSVTYNKKIHFDRLPLTYFAIH